MDRSRYLELLQLDGQLLADAATLGLDAAIPACPGWTVSDAVAHTAEVYEHKIACIALGGRRPDPWPPSWPSERDPREWFKDAHARLLDTLNSTDPAAPSWTWWPADQTAGFWVRRMAQETAVHRADVQSAFGPPSPVDPELALDGIDEVLVRMLAGDWSDEPQPGSSLCVEVRSGGQSWLVRATPVEVEVSRDAARAADALVVGEPDRVLLWLWGRAPDAAVAMQGDVAAAHRFRERLAVATT